MSEIEALEKRRKVVTDQIVRLRQELMSLESELMELDMAGKVIARVTGKPYHSPDNDSCNFQSGSVRMHAMVNPIGNADFLACQAFTPKLRHVSVFPPPPAGFVGGSPGWDVMANKELSLPEKITVALRYAHAQDVEALEPKQIERYLIILFGEVPEKQNVNSVAWRMAKSGTLCKAENAPRYWLPQMNKTADTSPAKGQSAALDATRAKGREAAPGGGI